MEIYLQHIRQISGVTQLSLYSCLSPENIFKQIEFLVKQMLVSGWMNHVSSSEQWTISIV